MTGYVTYRELSRAGRLGNQLWEIASTIGLGETYSLQPRFPAWDYQPFFNIPDVYFLGIPGPRGREIMNERPATDLVPHLDPRAKAYLQDFNLWSHIEDDVRLYFEPSDVAAEHLEEIWEANGFHELDNIISVHIRRGDNVTHPPGFHPLRSWDYYRAALEQVGAGDVAVFTDDWTWCAEHFEQETGVQPAIIYVGTPRPREYADRQAYDDAEILDWIDLQLMAACDRHIISNSTYAWWGAFLSADTEPIYPSNWFGHQIRDWTDASLMFPPGWLEVPDPTMGGI